MLNRRNPSVDSCYFCNVLGILINKMSINNRFRLSNVIYTVDHRHDLQTFSNIFFEIIIIGENLDSLGKQERRELLVKRSTNHEMLSNVTFQFEQLFYKSIAPILNEVSYLMPRYYTMEESSTYVLNSFVILENLTNNRYYVLKNKWDECHMLFCMKHLARFHNRMFDIQIHNANTYKIFYNNITGANMTENRDRQLKRIRFFKCDESIWSHLDYCLKLKLLTKVNEIENDCQEVFESKEFKLEKSNFITIIHGRFIRSKVMFKCDKTTGQPFKVKFIGWQSVSIGSPVIDFGRILFSNMPNTNNINKLLQFIEQMLTAYLDNIVYGDKEAVKKEFINKLLLIYIDHFWTIEHPINLLHALNKLGSLT